MRRKLIKGMLLIVLAICMNITTQAAYYAYTATVKNQIQLTKVNVGNILRASESDAIDVYTFFASESDAEKIDLYKASDSNVTEMQASAGNAKKM